MIDDPEIADYLVARLSEAVPFQARLGSRVAKFIAGKIPNSARSARWTVETVTYAGDEGGIVCGMRTAEVDNACHISITQLLVERNAPFFRQIDKYQRHRIKKLKKQGRDDADV